MPDLAARSKPHQPGEQLAMVDTCEDMPEAVSEPQGGPESRYPCGLATDEIVAAIITEFDAEEGPFE